MALAIECPMMMDAAVQAPDSSVSVQSEATDRLVSTIAGYCSGLHELGPRRKLRLTHLEAVCLKRQRTGAAANFANSQPGHK